MVAMVLAHGSLDIARLVDTWVTGTQGPEPLVVGVHVHPVGQVPGRRTPVHWVIDHEVLQTVVVCQKWLVGRLKYLVRLKIGEDVVKLTVGAEPGGEVW